MRIYVVMHGYEPLRAFCTQAAAVDYLALLDTVVPAHIVMTELSSG